MTLEEFNASDVTVDAVARNLGIIGEAAGHVPAEVRKRYPLVPWSQMRGMRNIIVHEYSSVDVVTIWRTVEENLPPLKPMLLDILHSED